MIQSQTIILKVNLDMNETPIGLKKFATLLLNNWLAETPQALALMRIGRQPAKRERISEIIFNIFIEKNGRQLV
ncbi:hypothetical protein ACFQ9Y_08555 [Peribacillus simplex]|uniref:hypothetical protein n=1 Tax=Peribacillus simplex TaxID=1478 RepID=UPI00366FF9B4